MGQCEIRRDTPFPDLEVENKLWSLYLDDANLLEIMEERAAKELTDKPSEDSHWGIPVNLDKSLARSSKAEKLGAVLHSELGRLRLRAAMKRGLDSVGLAFWILRQEEVPRKILHRSSWEVKSIPSDRTRPPARLFNGFVGSEVHTLRFRRPLFALFIYLWKEISDKGAMIRLGVKSVEEILMASCSQPLRFTDLRL